MDWVDFSDPSQIFEPSSITGDLKIPYGLIFFDAMGGDRERGGSPSPNQFADPQRGGRQTDDWEPVQKIFRKRRPVNKSTGTVPSPTVPSCPPSALPISGTDILLLPHLRTRNEPRPARKYLGRGDNAEGNLVCTLLTLFLLLPESAALGC